MDNQQRINKWFTPASVREAVAAISGTLTKEKLTTWIEKYSISKINKKPANIGVIMAGNIPLVGFHDFLSVLITGNRFIGKTSSKDSRLIKEIEKILIRLDPRYRKLIKISDNQIENIDAIIATGSDNTSRYFEYHYGSRPHIFRKNRNSVAIIYNDTTKAEIRDLGSDIFSYFGLGCRNVSKIYLPADFNLSILKEAWQDNSSIINHQPYRNNYNYNKALYRLNKTPLYDMGYFILKEDFSLSSPLAVLYFEYYNDSLKLHQNINFFSDKIQVVIDRTNHLYGSSQAPELWDYADNKDTIKFLLSLQ